MKKLFLFAVIAFAIASCGPKKVEPATTGEDSIVKIDTLKADTLKADTTASKTDSVVAK